MKNDKITIDIYPLSEKLTIIAAIIVVTAFLIISFIVDGIAWWIIVCYFLGDIACMVGAYRILRSKIVLDESLEVLKLYDFRSRIIPVEEIKVIEREITNGEKYEVQLEVKEKFRGRAAGMWLNEYHIFMEIVDCDKELPFKKIEE